MKKKIDIKQPKTLKNHGSDKTKIDSWVDHKDEKQRFTVDLPINIHRKLKMISAECGKSMGEIIIEFIAEL